MFIRWVEDKALTQHLRESMRFRSDRHSSLLDLVTAKYENNIQSLSSHTSLKKIDRAMVTFTFRLREDNVHEKLRKNFETWDAEKLTVSLATGAQKWN